MKWQGSQQEWHEVDHTETIYDNLDPDWTHRFNVIFNFGQTLHLKFDVFDQDDNKPPELIGSHETTLAELVRQKEGTDFPLKSTHTNPGCLNLVI